MRTKSKLYMVNKWNKPFFMPKENLFAGPQLGPSQMQRLKLQNMSTNPGGFTPSLPKGGMGSLSASNPTEFFGLGTTGDAGAAAKGAGLKGFLDGAGGAALSAGAGLVGSLGSNLIGGGLQSEAGAAIGNIGSTVGSAIGAVNPIAGAAVSVGSQLLGGLANAAFGSKLNEEKIAEVQQQNAKLNQAANTLAGSSGKEGLLSGWNDVDTNYSFNQGDIGEDGWFSNKAEKKYEELKRAADFAKQNALLGFRTGLHNVETDEDDAIASNFIYALGGDLQTNGADFGNGLVFINKGGSHEANPNDGVQLGVDNEGTPNLVEEGETVFDDYVYSARILADEQTKQMFRLPKKKDITFADISKKLERESAERPNDPISIAGLKAQMHDLADQQERQKQEMEAERAKAAFNALSPEEQVAIMENAAQQEQMAQQAAQEQAIAEQQAMQQPSPEEMQMIQQQQPMQADGTQAALGQEVPMMAEGGKLFKKGGYKWSSFWTPVNEYSKQKGNAKNKYQIDKTYKGDIKELENSDAYKAFTDYILNDATDEERLNYFKWIDANTGKENKYLDKDGKLLEGWQEAYKNARNDGLYGIQHYTPEFDPELMVDTISNQPAVSTVNPEARIHHAMDGDDYDGYIEGELDPNVVGAETRRETLPNGDIVIYHSKAKAPVTTSETDSKKEVAPIHRPEGLRYAGLFGPAVGLGMMAAGIGRPDYSGIDAALSGAGDVHLADWKPIGDYLTYRPMDIWAEQNALNAQARATDRGILNSGLSQGAKMAGLLASGYNNQLTSGDLYRKALEYNDAKREKVAAFNRGTNQYNSEQYGQNSRFNAQALNQGNQFNKHMQMSAAREKMNGDAGWYNSLYGNVAGLFKGIGDIGTENFRMNRIGEMAARGDFGVATPDTYGFSGLLKNKAKGGKINRKKSKK